jgi:signal peptidase I
MKIGRRRSGLYGLTDLEETARPISIEHTSRRQRRDVMGKKQSKKKQKVSSKKSTPTKENQEQAPPPKTRRRVFQEYGEAFVMALILAILIRGFFVQAFKIPSSSMVPTLLIGDHILVSKFVYGLRVPFTDIRWPRFFSPERGDVIVFIYPVERAKDFIKRVVAVAGDKVEMREKKLFVNGEEVNDTHGKHLEPNIVPPSISPRDTFGPIMVPEGRLFVMGDNRDRSLDSRFWGFVPVKDVRGKAFLIYYSAERFPNIRGSRLFSLIR